MDYVKSTDHSAEAAALGFYYQAFYALYALLKQPNDDATVCLERLDDVEVNVNGQSLLHQLKHSMSMAPAPVTISSRALWKTIKAWIDVLPRVVINETIFQLVAVAPIGSDGVLKTLFDDAADRQPLHDALVQEAERVTDEIEKAKQAKTSPLPHADRAAGCKAFLEMDKATRLAFVKRVKISTGNSNIVNLRTDIVKQLTSFLPQNREAIAERLLRWWDLQVIYTLTGARHRFIGRVEVLAEISEINATIERDELAADFELRRPPPEHQPDSMLERQIDLVQGTKTDYEAAVREQWRAYNQRHLWSSTRLDMAARLVTYDSILEEAWSDKHGRMAEDCETRDENEKCLAGRDLLRWTHEDAHKEVRPLAKNWSAPYYVRGAYQTLAISLRVGWHPEFEKMLGKVK
ncbi:hypothetical protein R69608_03210 [Paraburkholderia nemoris]|uniref:ABC-three component system protein n=1 Tax=Paraburkholderia nemoris TaxID=2793076 RepID=UPI00191215A4|nr:ABC-three component system protein [Paraburkholderia nemoris]MBK5148535.1 hypothetical protein [Burkholderia sp. R-69608]CAE6905977.1 hypothetical protein R69608_03210 [Paraburkholderia nemoris]